MSWIEKEEAKIPSYSRQELEGLYRGMMKINSIYEKKEDELFIMYIRWKFFSFLPKPELDGISIPD